MLETIQNFESVMGPAARDYPLVVTAPGGAAVAVGLFVWLGGFGFKRVLMAIAWAGGGAALSYFVVGWGLIPTVASACVAAGIAAILDRVFIALFASILVALIGFIVLVGPHLKPPPAQPEVGGQTDNAQAEPEAQTVTASSTNSMEELKAYLFDVGGQVRRTGSELPVYQWGIVLLLAILLLVGGFVFRRLVAALTFSVLGTLLIAAGLLLLLLYKGSMPLSQVGNRPLMYAGIFTGMVAFGTIQLLFCQGGLLKPAKKPKTDDFDDEDDTKRRRTF
jgi:hypothetical protein